MAAGNNFILAAILCLGLVPGTAQAQEKDREPHGLSRGDLYRIFVKDAGLESPQDDNTDVAFRFPHAGSGGRYGIDVSHHQGDIDWHAVSGAGVHFTYVKATEGVTYVDPLFKVNLSGARDAGLPTGVYHFLSSGDPVDQQVENFLAQYRKLALEQDLPPVLDLEWDYSHKTGKDRWEAKSASDITDMALAWLQAIEKALKRKPLIYTNRHWWDQRLGNKSSGLQDYEIWMSHYGGLSADSPPMMPGFEWAIWQFTDKGAVSGIPVDIDVNLLDLRLEKMGTFKP